GEFGQMPELTQFIVNKVRRLLIVSNDKQPVLARREQRAADSAATVGNETATPASAAREAPLELPSRDAAATPALETIADPASMRDLAATVATGLATGASKAFVIALL